LADYVHLLNLPDLKLITSERNSFENCLLSARKLFLLLFSFDILFLQYNNVFYTFGPTGTRLVIEKLFLAASLAA
jgi:hypothetical protein